MSPAPARAKKRRKHVARELTPDQKLLQVIEAWGPVLGYKRTWKKRGADPVDVLGNHVFPALLAQYETRCDMFAEIVRSMKTVQKTAFTR